jgi:hypothetical protein
LFNEISIKVMLEPDDGTSRKSYTPLTEEELGSYNALVDSPAKIHPSSVFFPPSPETHVDVLSANFQQSRDDVVELVGGPTSPGGSFYTSSGGVEDLGNDPCGGVEVPEGAATCTSAGAVGYAGGSAAASVEAGLPPPRALEPTWLLSVGPALNWRPQLRQTAAAPRLERIPSLNQLREMCRRQDYLHVLKPLFLHQWTP